MNFRKVVFFFWGGVYWPFMLVGVVFMMLFEIFSGIGAWLHDLLVDWAHPIPPLTAPVCRDCEIWPDSRCQHHQGGK